MTATFIPTANYNPAIEGNVQIACGLTRDQQWPAAGAASGTTLRSFSQARNTTTRQIMAARAGSTNPQQLARCRMFSSYSPQHILGIKDTTDCEDLKVSVVDGKAGEATFFYIALQGLNNGGASDPDKILPFIINVRIDYTLKFTEPQQDQNSPINP